MAECGYEPIGGMPAWLVANELGRGPGYNKTTDLHLLRALQNSTIVDGSFVYDRSSTHGRDEATLSSVVGTEVSDNGAAHSVIKKLIGCISLGANGTLEVDSHAFDKELTWCKPGVVLVGQPDTTISDRLQRIRYSPDNPTIHGSMSYDRSSAVSMHNDLEKFVEAPSLQPIGRSVLGAVGQERGALFSHEEAVHHYCQEKVLRSYGLTPAEKADKIMQTIAGFPNADPDIVMHLVRSRLEQNIKSLATRRAFYKKQLKAGDPSGDNAYYLELYEKKHQESTELLQVLGRPKDAASNKLVRWYRQVKEFGSK